MRKNKPAINVTGFWMRTVPFTSSGDVVRDQGSDLQAVEVLIEHNGKWLTIFGPRGAGECAYVNAQSIDNMIHAGGVRSLIDHGGVHRSVRVRTVKKPDRRDGMDRRGDKRRTGDKVKAVLAARKR